MKNKRVTRKVRSGESRVVKVKTETSGLGALKTVIVMTIIFSQLGVLIYLYVEIALAFRWYLLVSFAMSLLTCIYVLSSNKNSLSKAVWIIFLLVFFIFGYAIYIMSDERFFFSRAKRRYRSIFSSSEKYIPGDSCDSLSAKNSVINNARYLYNAGKFAAYKNTKLEYFSSGTKFFDDVLETLKGAESFVFMEFFIISDGILMKRFFDILSQKAANGVDIRIIYDDMGSHKTLSRKTKKKLKAAGIKLLPFNRLLPVFSIGLNFRDHRKIIVIDGKTAYTGGCNFADEYVNEKRLYGYWKDSGIRLDGEGVDAFTLFFLRQWEYLFANGEDFGKYFGKSLTYESDSVTVPYIDGLDFDAPISKNAYENIIASAEKRLYIMTPYFIVEDTINNLIINKARSGVDVRIVLPGVPDKKLVYGVSEANAEKLIKYGVKIYYMKNSFVHSKLVLTENAVIVGSANMDLRSFYQQFESSVFTNDEKLMSEVHFDFTETFKESNLMSKENQRKRNVLKRAFGGLLQMFAPFM